MEAIDKLEHAADRSDSSMRKRIRAARAKGVQERDESGAVLILALVFLVIVGALVGSLTGWAGNDLNNTAKFTANRTLQYAASSAVETGIANIRYTPLFATQLPAVLTPPTTTSASPSFCWGSSATAPSALQIDNINMSVWCSTAYTPTSSATRVVTLSACPLTGTTTGTSCAASPTLQAVVTFDDYPSGSNPPIPDECVAYCGSSMTVNGWKWAAGVTLATPTTTTTTVPPTTTTTTTTAPTNGVTVTPLGTASNSYSGTDQLTFTNSSSITALTVTIRVAQTTGVSYANAWNSFPGNLTQSETTSGGYIVYSYVQNSTPTPAQTNGQITAQWAGNGTARVTSGDLWSVTSTSGGVTSTLSGTF
jgi:hypothetical protein